jgi:septal ring-binding cell division protein DamX
VVLIDEAHAMPVETLEEIRLLSNLEANRNKLLQLVLFGQPELNDILARPDMRQLKERITHNFGLAPLVHDDISHYLDFRMRAAGYRGPSVFSQAALKLIAQSSLGLTRRINILADKALLAAFSTGSHQIGPKEIQAAIRDCEFSEATYGGQAAKKRTMVLAATAIGICILAGIAYFAVSGGDAPQAAAPKAVAGTVGTPQSGPAPSAVPTSAEAASPPPAAAVAAPSTPTPVVATPVAAPPPAPASPPAAVAAQSPAPAPADKSEAATPPTQVTPHKLGPLTTERLEAGQAWLRQLPDDRWFIQLFATDASRHAEVENLLRRLPSSGVEMDKVHVYYSELSGKPRFGVTYGNFPSAGAASAAARSLPQMLRANKPYPRPAIRLR